MSNLGKPFRRLLNFLNLKNKIFLISHKKIHLFKIIIKFNQVYNNNNLSKIFNKYKQPIFNEAIMIYEHRKKLIINNNTNKIKFYQNLYKDRKKLFYKNKKQIILFKNYKIKILMKI